MSTPTTPTNGNGTLPASIADRAASIVPTAPQSAADKAKVAADIGRRIFERTRDKGANPVVSFSAKLGNRSITLKPKAGTLADDTPDGFLSAVEGGATVGVKTKLGVVTGSLSAELDPADSLETMRDLLGVSAGK